MQFSEMFKTNNFWLGSDLMSIYRFRVLRFLSVTIWSILKSRLKFEIRSEMVTKADKIWQWDEHAHFYFWFVSCLYLRASQCFMILFCWNRHFVAHCLRASPSFWSCTRWFFFVKYYQHYFIAGIFSRIRQK